MENQNADVRIVLEEMRRQFDMGLRTGELLDQKAGASLVAAGALIVLAMGRQVSVLSGLPKTLAVAIAVLYAGVFILAMASIKTRDYKVNISTDWDELTQRMFNETERDATLVMVSSYIEAIEWNRKRNDSKARLVEWGLWGAAATVVLTIVLVICG